MLFFAPLSLLCALLYLAVGSVFAWGAFVLPHVLGSACFIAACGCLCVAVWSTRNLLEEFRDIRAAMRRRCDEEEADYRIEVILKEES